MPIVQALCLNDAWDSQACFYYEKGRTYPIDTDTEFAHMMVRPMSSGKVDQKTGEIVAAKLTRTPLPVFQFDRAAPMGAVGDGRPSDYTCKKCGAKKDPLGRPFTLNTLSTHTRTAHKEESAEDETEGEAVVRKASTCKQCNPPQVFESRGEMMKHKGEVHGAKFFKKKFGQQPSTVEEAVTATA
jgi:hypothetical protein